MYSVTVLFACSNSHVAGSEVTIGCLRCFCYDQCFGKSPVSYARAVERRVLSVLSMLTLFLHTLCVAAGFGGTGV